MAQKTTQKSSPTDIIRSLKNEIKQEGFSVVKRNGSLVPFRRERIHHALEFALRDTKKIGKEASLPKEIEAIVDDMTDKVVAAVLQESFKGACITVEGIQDMVEVTLMKHGHHDVAKDYILYRNQHKKMREDSWQSLKIMRRDGSMVRFNPMKIASAIEEAFRSKEQLEGPSSQHIIDAVNLLTEKVIARAIAMNKAGKQLSVDLIDDEVEEQLMQAGFFAVAKQYIIFRATGVMPAAPAKIEKKELRSFSILLSDGSRCTLSEEQIKERILHAAQGFETLVSVDELLESVIVNFYEGMKENELDLALLFASRAKIEKEPAYSKVSARLLLNSLYRETMEVSASDAHIKSAHINYFKKAIKYAITVERLSPALLDFDLDKLAHAIDLSRDDLFSYLGLQTLYDRYFLHHQEKRIETPQIFWMRVAMGLALNEGEQKNERAIEFYNLLSSFLFVSGTPTLFNSGTRHSQLSSCYLSTISDDLSHIFKVISDDAQLSKWAGGIGNDWTNVRATGALIKGTNGKSQGIIPFLKVANDTAVAVNQCFAPDTRLYTAKGVKAISDVRVKDLVLGISGTYREVTETFLYNQKDSMVCIHVKHAITPITVTSGHPFYAISGVPMEQAVRRTMQWLSKGKIQCQWIDAQDLKKGDYIAQVIPQEIVAVEDFDEEDARFYGILLGDGHLTKNGYQFGVSGNPKNDTHLEFVRSYLRARNIHFWETTRGDSYLQIHFSSGYGALRDATTGRITGSVGPTLPLSYDDLYDSEGNKHIAPRFSHLPRPHTLALIQGLVETDGNISRNKEITFTNTSAPLIESLRYQMLRLGTPTAGKFRTRNKAHVAKRSDGSSIHFKGGTTSCDLRIPAIAELAERIGCKPLTKTNWLTYNGFLFTRITKNEKASISPFVHDLRVEGDESYMTTSALAHNGGKRKGAMCAYLETWHLDIEDFLELRKNTGDERRRTHDMNTANWIPDLFMKRVEENGMWTLFSPSDVPDLHDLYGSAFEKRYIEYEKMVKEGKIKLYKQIEAIQLWRKMLSMLFETGHPWITFKDPSNIRSPQDHVGVVHSSNLCTEILLNTSPQETAVCNLGSINLALHTTPQGIDRKKLAKTIHTAVRMLDNVIEINYYPTDEAKTANLRHRPIGMGLMGFQDALYIQGISYASHEAVQFSDTSMELIAYYAILASSELAKERGVYSTYKGSKWDRGLLPLDTLDILAKERGGYLEVDRSSTLDWQPVREHIKKHGMRNSNTMAIAPTATISNITGVTQSIEPMYKHLFVKSNLSGEFTIPNEFLVSELKRRGLWDAEMLDDLKYFDGSIAEIARIPDEVKRLFLTAFEIEPEWIIECASRRQKWLDMGQSLNLYLQSPSGKKLDQMYRFAHLRGLKTLYYLRSLAATQLEKSTTDINKRGLQPRWMKHASASSNIKVERSEGEEIKACPLDGSCESCQ